jgi:hypothetical protein
VKRNDMNPQITFWQDPPRMETGAPEPCLLVLRPGTLYCAYFVSEASEDLTLGIVAILRFDVVLHHCFGYPNDEVLHSHLLYKNGLKHYHFHIVEPSPLIAEIEEQNRIHRQHRPGMYSSRFKHFLIAFHGETLEVVAQEGIVAGRSNLPPDQAIAELASGE